MTRPIRVLLVEDNPGDAYLVKDALAETGLRLDIDVVGDGQAAIDYLRRRSGGANGGDAPTPDVVFLDLNLPKMSGHEVLKEARQSIRLRGPIIVLTSSDAAQDVATSYALGASCYVTKPGELAAFQAAVKAVGVFWFGTVTLP